MSHPIVFAFPADTDLIDDPIRSNWIVEGAPEARSKCLAQSADGTSRIVAWSCSAGRFNWQYAVDEAVHVVSGEVFVRGEGGQVRRLGPGDTAFFPAGTRAVWHVPERVRKIAVCRYSMPRPLGRLLCLWNRAVDRLTGFSRGRNMLEQCPITAMAGGRFPEWEPANVDKRAARP